ncbi:SusC/RagA family TonB-linked outer membrane protein [Balneola vulgaris]|uniref:SusC/RagA family TonB-linked outer membrane protein n=1 Tax=Balneola vulgaris TaxID=287535 RepID=UPI000A0076E6|nr:SusC/RagA family TonB-linked outer membrane protein [Balneola vulgaris]
MKRAIQSLLLCFVALIASEAMAQSGVVRGTVMDTNDETIPGVTVIIQLDAKTLGAITNADGEYVLNSVPAGVPLTVTARSVGFRSEDKNIQLSAGEELQLDFTLFPSTLNLDELVVTGTGAAVERQSVGHTISSVKFEDVESVASNSVQDALLGKVSGVSINGQGGAVDQEPKIRIRGTSSLSMSNQPIIYVDGVRVAGAGGFAPGVNADIGAPSGLGNINFDSIERVEILKGPAAATLYGSQANAGVIQIFTKQGSQESAPQFDIELNTQFIQMPNRFKANTGFVESASEQQNVKDILGLEVDFYEPFESPIQLIDLYGLGMGQEISGSVQGGGKGMTYFANLRYTHTDGPFDPSPSNFNGGAIGDANDLYKKFFFNGNLNLIPSNDFTLRLQTAYTNSNTSIYESGITIYTPTSTSRYAKPERVGQASQYDTFGIPFFATVREGTYPEVTDNTNQGRFVLQANYLPSDEVSIDASMGLDYRDQRSRRFARFQYAVDGVAPTSDGSVTIGTRQQLVWSFESKVNWTKNFNEDVKSTFVAGFQGSRDEINSSTGSGQNFSGPGLEVLGATASQTASSSFLEVVDLGMFVQEQIDYKDYLYVTGGLRLDASSAFGDETNYATYPKVSVSFLPTDAFDFEIPSVSTFRVRGAWGQSGQQPGAFDRFTTYVPVNSPDGAGVVPGNLGNQDLKPEVATEWEIGFELGFMQDRVGFEATYWDRVVQDALIDRTYAPSGGFTTPQLTNAGELIASGLELSINADVIQKKDFQLNVFANAAYLYEQVNSLGGAPPIKIDATYVRDRMYIKEGYAPASYFGAMLPSGVAFPFDTNQDGIPDSQAELEAYFAGPVNPSDFNSAVMVAGEDGQALPGGSSYLDHYLGKPTPDWEGSFGFMASLPKNFSVSTRFQYAAGNYYHHNLTGAFRRTNSGIGRNFMKSTELEAILKNPASTTQQRIDAGRKWVTEILALSPFDGLNEIEKADYIRWSNLSISYAVPKETLEKLGVKSASITATGNNLALWSKYSGVDPLATGEASRGGGASLRENFGGGMDTYGTPLLRSYSLTLKFGF